MLREVTPEEIAKIQSDAATWQLRTSAELKEVVARSYRVCDLRGVTKGSLIFMILKAQYGERRVLVALDTKAGKK